MGPQDRKGLCVEIMNKGAAAKAYFRHPGLDPGSPDFAITGDCCPELDSGQR